VLKMNVGTIAPVEGHIDVLTAQEDGSRELGDAAEPCNNALGMMICFGKRRSARSAARLSQELSTGPNAMFR